MLILFVGIVAAGIQAASVPTPPSAEQDIEVVGKIDPKERRICVRSTPTGSIMAKKQCKTVAQWEADIASGKTAANGMVAQQLQVQLNIMRSMINRDGAAN